MKKLVKLQSELKAPKNQYNSFGKYKYRSCEDILEAVKPLLAKHGLIMYMTDTIKEVSGIPYIESTVMIEDIAAPGEAVSSTAQAGIDPSRKGMDIAQSFGSSASYSRKYALSALLLLDESEADLDASEAPKKTSAPRKKTTVEKAVSKKGKKVVTGTPEFNKVLDWIEDPKKAGTIEKALEMYDIDKATENAIRTYLTK